MALLLPMGMLLGGLYSVGKLNKQNELIAIKASGISLYRFMFPFLLVGVISTMFNFYLTGWRVPQSKHQEKIFEEQFTGGAGYTPMSRSNFNLYDSTNRFLFVKLYSEETSTFSNVAIQEFETGQITRRIDAEVMKYDTLHSQWVLFNGIERTMKGDNITFNSFVKKDSVKLGFSVSDILSSKKTPEELSLIDHKNFLDLRKKIVFGGTEEIEVKWHEKISFPFACLIVSMLVVPIASQQRKAGLGLWSEVKLRTNDIMGTALESIPPKKQQRIIKTSKTFLIEHAQFEKMNMQYSVIAIQKKEFVYNYDFIENAFCLNSDIENDTPFP
ncbi:hypothetical protein CHS0354_023851 [Potamilus streckersoni]|uniref:Uncharacterized protein n=1 Tax=Potamilus streckersoni TaxID=2493646 RepID=A0AAE0RZR3_9BIVA|nr:hypothetical protein CHS0354_023851 [Potamilus streckersoni]